MAQQAPWRSLFQSHLTQNSSTSFTLSTVGHDAQNRPVPRSRLCEFRGFWPSPKLHESAVEALNAQGIGQNPAAYESDMLSLTTDVRMDKVSQLESSANAVEGMFWLADVRNQWRVKGEAFVIGDPKDGMHEEEARKEIRRGMRALDNGAEWSWERQVTTYFANHSPVMRGSFRNPSPGQPRARGPVDPGLELGLALGDLRDPVARGNFRVVVVRPTEVERLDLSDVQNVRRVRWTFVPTDNQVGRGEWVETELWP
ncbi:pyridoxamine 5'-phosphate oxidase-domain-containing protein [Aspergillus coremiiformis]|uniref:Pyridoxamine 5'-phosphate oxidase-domain-containing protein n=1 Tax=Aspergillus coremiiformis TaxID=138285 RepID=A0A5N6Z1M6_9EURO|nr:pyridoxamine 5'-phosphate oxidase-domain-containing protein [Aspergillus coremiiformis]